MEKSTIYVGNLTQEVDEEVLRAAFIPFGEIKSIEIPSDPMTGINNVLISVGAYKGFAHIEFEEAEDCQHAIFNMNDSEFFNKVIRVQYAKPNKKANANKPVWQTEEYQQTVAELPPERSGLVRVSFVIT